MLRLEKGLVSKKRANSRQSIEKIKIQRSKGCEIQFDFMGKCIIIQNMSSEYSRTASYAHITPNMRKLLIDLVENESYPISLAANEVGIKLSTAKQIIKRYRKNHTIYLRKEEKGLESKQFGVGGLSSTKVNPKMPDQNLPHQEVDIMQPCQQNGQNQQMESQPIPFFIFFGWNSDLLSKTHLMFF